MPAHSNTQATPSPASSPASVSGTVRSPNDSARPARAALRDTTASRSKPRSRSTSAVSSPTGPAPITITGSDGESAAVLTARTATPSGSTSVPARSETVSGSANSIRSSTIICSA